MLVLGTASGQNTDILPPVLTSYSVDPSTADVLAGPVEVTITAGVSDSGTGVKLVTGLAVNPVFATQETCVGELTDGDEFDGTYECVLVLPEESALGVWVLTILLTDEADNFSLATGNVLTAFGAPSSITVIALIPAPTATPDSYSTPEDVQLVGSSVLANDQDATEAILASPPEHGTLALSADGTFTYDPDPEFSGSDLFRYVGKDDTRTTDTTDVSIDVVAVNDLPLAPDTSLAVQEDQTATLTFPSQDVEGESVSYRVTGQPSSGQASFAGAVFSYTPNADFEGQDEVRYVASDGVEDAPEARIAITVGGLNDGPAASVDAYTLDEDTALLVSAGEGVLANDTDVDGDALTAQLLDRPLFGALVLNPDGSFEYQPQPDFHGEDGFTYRATDANTESPAVSVRLIIAPVNDAPVASAAQASVAAGESVTLTLTASDVDGDALSYFVQAPGPQKGSLQLAGNLATYTATAGSSGEDVVAYRVFDGQLYSTPAEILITIGGVNQAPVTQADSYATREDQVLEVSAASGVLANDTDPDGQPLSTSLESRPSHGSLIIDADGGFQYTPAKDFHGQDSFTYVATDGNASVVGTVSVQVLPVNDPPHPGQVVAPGPGATLILSGDPSGAIEIRWARALDPEGDPVEYRWVVADDVLKVLFASPWLTSTSFETTVGELGAALTAGGIDRGSVVQGFQWLEVSDGEAETTSSPIEITLFRGAITGAESDSELPADLGVSVAPQPVSGIGRVALELPTAGAASVRVLDLLGRSVARIHDGYLAAGTHYLNLDLSSLGAGAYLLVFDAAERRLTKPILLIK
ncbi:MAG: tandem-95 repeat protein [Rhodothermales bacterium]|nr:tandem-95 repeat protein [Rhodothermales bacterium]